MGEAVCRRKPGSLHHLAFGVDRREAVDLLYGQMLCWDMSGGDYSFAGRTREFCDTFLPGLMAPYLHGKEG